MLTYKHLLTFLFVICHGFAESGIFYNVIRVTVRCEQLCMKTYSTGSLPNMERIASCSRGCRFFNLVQSVGRTEEQEHNTTKDMCEESCLEAYTSINDRYACNVGCSNMAQVDEDDWFRTQFEWCVYVDGSKNLLFLQPGDFETDDVLTDPGLKFQVEHKFGSNGIGLWQTNRLPQTYVRTFPADDDVMEEIKFDSPGHWLDCVARKAGLPRILLATIVMFAILLAVWICLSPDRQSVEYFEVLENESKGCHDYPPKYFLHLDQV